MCLTALELHPLYDIQQKVPFFSRILTFGHFQNIQMWISFQNFKAEQKCNDSEKATQFQTINNSLKMTDITKKTETN